MNKTFRDPNNLTYEEMKRELYNDDEEEIANAVCSLQCDDELSDAESENVERVDDVIEAIDSNHENM